jgi:type I restriction enzyme S subunit
MDQEMRKRGTGVAIPGLNSSNFKELPLPKIQTSSAEWLNKRLTPMLTAMLRFARQSVQLANLRDTLLPELLTGEAQAPVLNEVTA